MLRKLGGFDLRQLIIIGENSYITQSLARVLSDELSCSASIFKNVDSWKRSPYTQCEAFIVVDTPTSLGLLSCSEVVSQLRQLDDDAPIIVISDSDATANVTESIRCGARGYIPTSTTLDEALEAIRLVLSGGAVAWADIVLPGYRPNKGNG